MDRDNSFDFKVLIEEIDWGSEQQGKQLDLERLCSISFSHEPLDAILNINSFADNWSPTDCRVLDESDGKYWYSNHMLIAGTTRRPISTEQPTLKQARDRKTNFLRNKVKEVLLSFRSNLGFTPGEVDKFIVKFKGKFRIAEELQSKDLNIIKEYWLVKKKPENCSKDTSDFAHLINDWVSLGKGMDMIVPTHATLFAMWITSRCIWVHELCSISKRDIENWPDDPFVSKYSRYVAYTKIMAKVQDEYRDVIKTSFEECCLWK